MATPTFIIYDGDAVDNPDREVISHSIRFHDWGLRFRDRGPDGQGIGPDAMIFQAAGVPILSVVIGNGNVGIGVPANRDPSTRLEVSSDTTNDAILGTSLNGSTQSAGVRGVSNTNSSNGVIGEANNGVVAYGVWGKSTSGYAGVFSGDVHIFSNGIKNGDLHVAGTITQGMGGFTIDHPLDPENKHLSHSYVESPDMLNVYNGNITTDANGNAAVRLPDYFEALNQDFRYQLTVIGQFAQAIVAGEIRNNQFTIKTDKPNVKVSWQVTGIRKDPLANTQRLVVEEDKPADERGTYLHPKAYGKPETQGVAHAHGKGLQVP